MLEYDVVQNGDLFELVTAVDELLKAGWQLCGGLSVSLDEGGYLRFYQAVTRQIEKATP